MLIDRAVELCIYNIFTLAFTAIWPLLFVEASLSESKCCVNTLMMLIQMFSAVNFWKCSQECSSPCLHTFPIRAGRTRIDCIWIKCQIEQMCSSWDENSVNALLDGVSVLNLTLFWQCKLSGAARSTPAPPALWAAWATRSPRCPRTPTTTCPSTATASWPPPSVTSHCKQQFTE